MEFQANLLSEWDKGYRCVVADLKLGVKTKGAEVGGLPEVEGIREDDIMIGEGELDIVLVDAKDIAESRAFQFL